MNNKKTREFIKVFKEGLIDEVGDNFEIHQVDVIEKNGKREFGIWFSIVSEGFCGYSRFDENHKKLENFRCDSKDFKKS